MYKIMNSYCSQKRYSFGKAMLSWLCLISISTFTINAPRAAHDAPVLGSDNTFSEVVSSLQSMLSSVVNPQATEQFISYIKHYVSTILTRPASESDLYTSSQDYSYLGNLWQKISQTLYLPEAGQKAASLAGGALWSVGSHIINFSSFVGEKIGEKLAGDGIGGFIAGPALAKIFGLVFVIIGFCVALDVFMNYGFRIADWGIENLKSFIGYALSLGKRAMSMAVSSGKDLPEKFPEEKASSTS